MQESAGSGEEAGEEAIRAVGSSAKDGKSTSTQEEARFEAGSVVRAGSGLEARLETGSVLKLVVRVEPIAIDSKSRVSGASVVDSTSRVSLGVVD